MTTEYEYELIEYEADDIEEIEISRVDEIEIIKTQDYSAYEKIEMRTVE